MSEMWFSIMLLTLGSVLMWGLGYYSGKCVAEIRASEARTRAIDARIADIKANP